MRESSASLPDSGLVAGCTVCDTRLPDNGLVEGAKLSSSAVGCTDCDTRLPGSVAVDSAMLDDRRVHVACVKGVMLDRKGADVVVEARVPDNVPVDSAMLDDRRVNVAQCVDAPVEGVMLGRKGADVVVEARVPDDVESATNRQVVIATECEECCSGDESTVTIEEEEEEDDDNDLATDGGGVSTIPTFGSISVANSSDIHFGNRTFYQGPVTIKQLVYANGKDPFSLGGEEAFASVGDQPSGKDCEPHGALRLCLGRRRYIAWTVSLGLALVLAVSLTLVSRPGPGVRDSNRGELTYNRPNSTNDATLSGKLRILPRKEWLAQPPNQPYAYMELPVPYVIISHTATEHCFTQADCVFAVRTAQTYHIESKGWADIAYNFLVGGDGYVYTGRGWDAVGAHTFGFNTCGLGVSLIGTFLSDHPVDIQFAALKLLLEEGVRLGKISKDYKLIGHCQVSKTLSPGQALFDDIKALPHWMQKPVRCREARGSHSSTSMDSGSHGDI